jgi:hypothetical protein
MLDCRRQYDERSPAMGTGQIRWPYKRPGKGIKSRIAVSRKNKRRAT